MRTTAPSQGQPRIVLPSFEPTALFGVERTRQIEILTATHLPPHALMRRAGDAVARLALAVAPHSQSIWMAIGSGNNGGDGFEAACALKRAGKYITVTFTGAPEHLPEDARQAFEHALAVGVQFTDHRPTLGDHDLAIDALLGIGLKRPPEGALAHWIATLNESPAPVLSVDLPSGLNADSGQALGIACVRAQHTLSLLTLKPGLFTGAGRDFAGRIWFDDLGADESGVPAEAWLSGYQAIKPPHRDHAQHKGSFGDVLVIGGDEGMIGAAMLASSAAHAAGAGRVYVSLLDESAEKFAPLRPELMFRARAWDGAVELLSKSTIACGCGGGNAVAGALARLLGVSQRLLLDADALNAVSADDDLRALLAARRGRGRVTVLTPHPLEAARLLGMSASAVQADRLGAATRLADTFGCVVALKGSGTILAAPGRTPSINATGNASLASAGTGDVLAGWIAGNWAQYAEQDSGGPEEDPWRDALDATVSAVARHGWAAEVAGVSPLRAGELVEAMLAVGSSASPRSGRHVSFRKVDASNAPS